MFKIIKLVLNSSFFHLPIILIITFLIFRSLFILDGYPSYSDNSDLLVLNMERFNNMANFTYSEVFHGRIYDSNLILMNFLPNKVAVLFNNLFPDTRILSIFWVVFPYVTLNICVYFSFFNIFNEKRLSFLLTLFYIFSSLNLSHIAYGWTTTSYSIAFSFLLFSNLIKYLRCPTFKEVIKMSLLSLIAAINVANFYAAMFGVLVYLIIYFIVNKYSLKEFYRLYKSLLFLPVLSFLLNSYWIIPTIPMTMEVGRDFYLTNVYDSSALTSVNTFNFNTSFVLFRDYHEVFKFFTSNVYSVSFGFLLIITFYYIYKYSNNKLLKIFFFLYLLCFGLSLGDTFGLLWRVFQSLPGAFLIRSPQMKFYPLLFFFLSLLIGLIIKKYKPKILIHVLILTIFLGVVGFNRSKIFSYWTNVLPPEDYRELVYKFSTLENKYTTIAEFPKTTGMPRISWLDGRYSTPILNPLIYNPIIFNNSWNSSLVPDYIKDIYLNPLVDIPEILGSGGVKYVLLHKDYYNASINLDFLNRDGITKLMSGKNIELYIISDSLIKPLFYSGKKNLEYERINPVMHTVKAKPGEGVTFNRQHDVSLKLYDKKDIEDAGYYRCKFSIGGLNFCDILLLKVKPLSKQTLGKDYKNNWILPEGSSGSYVVYYQPQIYFYIGLIISFVAFILHILYLLLAKENDKNKEMVLN